jgi:hypothetical protein
METITTFNSCIECDQVITNPICPDCLSTRMKVMVAHHDKDLADQITGFKMDGDTHCLFCGQNMGLCAHCFSRETYNFIKEKKPEIANEFISRFDFDLRRNFI